MLFLIYVGRVTLSASLGGRGEVVVEDWWKASSKVKSTKEDSKDIEVVERKEVRKEEVSTSPSAKAKVEVYIEKGSISTNVGDESEGEEETRKEDKKEA